MASEFVISIVFILLDTGIVWIMGLFLADIMSQYVFFAHLFAGIKFASFFVIGFRCVFYFFNFCNYLGDT